jgi:pimeloyl-ACP methyl ester carboxylesterase
VSTPTSRAGRLFRALANVLTALFLVVSIPLTVGIYAQAYVEMGERARFPPPGQIIDIGGGEKIHVRTWGQANDRPTILLFISAYTPSSAWAWIAQSLSAEYRVVAFDRPGMGWSSGGANPRDAMHAADALTSALRIAGIGPPYVVIGHSYGGFSARVFAGQHRSDVRAIVLLDTSHPDAPGSGYGFFARLNALQAHSGMQLLYKLGGGFSSLPPGDAEATDAVNHWTSHLDASADELETWNASAAEVRAAGDFGDLPVLIVAGAEGEYQRGFQLDLVKLSTGSQLVDLNVGHIQMLIERDQAALVTDQITRFLAGALP